MVRTHALQLGHLAALSMKAGIQWKLKKSTFCTDEAHLLGEIVILKGRRCNDAKVAAVRAQPYLLPRKQVMRALGMFQWFSRLFRTTA